MSPIRKLAKTSENTKQDFRLFSFLAIMTLGCVHVLCHHGRMESPLNKLFTPSNGKHVLKRAESHFCEVNIWILACNLSSFLRFLKGICFRKSLIESERRDRF